MRRRRKPSAANAAAACSRKAEYTAATGDVLRLPIIVGALTAERRDGRTRRLPRKTARRPKPRRACSMRVPNSPGRPPRGSITGPRHLAGQAARPTVRAKLDVIAMRMADHQDCARVRSRRVSLCAACPGDNAPRHARHLAKFS
jgi:hypothetical protein